MKDHTAIVTHLRERQKMIREILFSVPRLQEEFKMNEKLLAHHNRSIPKEQGLRQNLTDAQRVVMNVLKELGGKGTVEDMTNHYHKKHPSEDKVRLKKKFKNHASDLKKKGVIMGTPTPSGSNMYELID